MGIFDLFKSKTPEQKRDNLFQSLRKKLLVKEGENKTVSFLGSNDVRTDEDPNGVGEFGLTETNPIPINGINNINSYVDKLRYIHLPVKESKSLIAKILNDINNSVTNNKDNYKIIKEKYFPVSHKGKDLTLNAENIEGNISAYNLYDLNGKIKARVFFNCFCLKTSNKMPKGFIHRDDISPISDMKLWIHYLSK